MAPIFVALISTLLKSGAAAAGGCAGAWAAGPWAPMDAMTAAEGAAFAQRVEGWGYSALWLPESRGRNVLAHSAWLLANTDPATRHG